MATVLVIDGIKLNVFYCALRISLSHVVVRYNFYLLFQAEITEIEYLNQCPTREIN